MAYDLYLGERIEQLLRNRHISYYTKKMMGGLVFFFNEKMAFGIFLDKSNSDSLLMLKIGEENYKREIKKEVTRPMDFTGKASKGYIFVTADGFDLEEDLSYWITLAVSYNATTYGK